VVAREASSKFNEGLRLTETERAVLLERMKRTGVADRRRSPRIIVEGLFPVLMTMVAPEGGVAHLKIYPWDISRHGLGFFHWSLVYPGTRCTFRGVDGRGQPFSITGEVVRCSHVSGNVHAVGTKLDAEIDPELLLGEHGSGHQADWWAAIAAHATEIAAMAGRRSSVESLRVRAAEMMRLLSTDLPASESEIHGEAAPEPTARITT
jgi:hypothetical protein